MRNSKFFIDKRISIRIKEIRNIKRLYWAWGKVERDRSFTYQNEWTRMNIAKQENNWRINITKRLRNKCSRRYCK